MKVLLFNKAYDIHINPSSPCRACTVDSKTCSQIPVAFCMEYGGFQSSDTKIFTL